MANVITMNGDPLTMPGQPDEDIVCLLEELLASARNGEIKGFAFVAAHHDNASTRGLSGERSYSMAGRLADLQRHVLEDLD